MVRDDTPVVVDVIIKQDAHGFTGKNGIVFNKLPTVSEPVIITSPDVANEPAIISPVFEILTLPPKFEVPPTVKSAIASIFV